MDVIMGMDWMIQHKVVLDISDRVVEINSPTVGHTALYLPFLRSCLVCHQTEMLSL
jgi:hypothetical protein